MNNYFDAPPGVLSDAQILELGAQKAITHPDGKPLIPDPSAIDLPIGKRAWKLESGFRPTMRELQEVIKKQAVETDDDVFTFEPRTPYLVELDHILDLPKNVSGRATGRSSVGRLDVITRLIATNCVEYDLVPPGYDGTLHLLVLPQTFAIKVKVGTPLNQLRLFCGSQFDAIISRNAVRHYGTPFWYFKDGRNCTPWPPQEERRDEKSRLFEDPCQLDLTVDLSGADETYIFKAKDNPDEHPLNAIETIKEANDPATYFSEEPIVANSVTLERGRFYILKSRERLYIPNTVAVEVVAISERIGDIRIHYAGFAHPEFGRDRARVDGKLGTPLIFEVRSTDMRTKLKHESLLARIQLFRMSKPYASPDRDSTSPYGTQELQLSNYFTKWTQ